MFLKYLNFCLDFFRHIGKQLDKKAKVNFKTYEVTNWETNNNNEHTAQYLKKQRTKQSCLISYYNVTREIFLLKNHT